MTPYQFNYVLKKSAFRPYTKVNDIRYSKSLKNRDCVVCGCEIPKGDLYYSYKPIGQKRKSRCIKHPPRIYNDYEPFDY